MGQKPDRGLWGLALRLACALAEAWAQVVRSVTDLAPALAWGGQGADGREETVYGVKKGQWNLSGRESQGSGNMLSINWI